MDVSVSALVSVLTTESKRVQTVFSPFNLQQEKEHLIVNLLALRADHNIYGPGDLRRANQANVSTTHLPGMNEAQRLRVPCNSGSGPLNYSLGAFSWTRPEAPERPTTYKI